MISGQRLVDIFTAAVVAVGLAIGGWGLAQKYGSTTSEDRALVTQCISNVPDNQTSSCSTAQMTQAQITQNTMDEGYNKALAGLFVIFAGGMIGSTASYARGFEQRLRNTLK